MDNTKVRKSISKRLQQGQIMTFVGPRHFYLCGTIHLLKKMFKILLYSCINIKTNAI